MKTITITIDDTCTDCANALKQFDIEKNREKRLFKTIKDRFFLGLLVDPDYNHWHVETIGNVVDTKWFLELGKNHFKRIQCPYWHKN